jgi:hypothetical protein
MTQKIWVTRYALTRGLYEIEAEIEEGGFACEIRDGRPMFSGFGFTGHHPDWHYTREHAIARAEQLRMVKIASLQKQIKKLEKMRFE